MCASYPYPWFSPGLDDRSVDARALTAPSSGAGMPWKLPVAFAIASSAGTLMPPADGGSTPPTMLTFSAAL